MADSRTRPFPTPSNHTNGASSTRERDFNNIFNTGRPIPQSHHPLPNGNGNGNGLAGPTHPPNSNTIPSHPSMKPGYGDGRNYLPSQRIPPQQQQQSYQESPKRSPPSRQYSLPNDVNIPPPRNAPPRGQQQYDPRQVDPRQPGQRQVSAPHPSQRIYNDIPPSHQRPPQDYPSNNDYRTKSLSAYNRPQPPSRQPVPYPTNDGYQIPPVSPNRMATTAEGRIVPERPYDRSFTMTSPPGNGDRSYSLTSTQPRRPDDRSYTLGADRSYSPTRGSPAPIAQPRRTEEGRSNTMSGRLGEEGRSNTMSGRLGGSNGVNSSPSMDFSRPVQPRQQVPPGSPRRPPPSSASSRGAMLGGVREEGPNELGQQTSPAQHTSLPPISTSLISGRHESVDSTYSDKDSIVSGPQRTKSSSSFPLISPSTANTDRRPSLSKPPSSQPSISRTRAPIVYPALLSRVALALRERLILGDKQKDGLTYPNAFTGSEAVDLIAYVIKTSDRNLALLLGRALDAQRWFHDVTYVHRLRDNPSEVYQFRERVPFDVDETNGNGSLSPATSRRGKPRADTLDSMALFPTTLSGVRTSSDSPEDDYLPNGVFTLLTECYSPTCTREKLCYSIACPRRLEQMARGNLKITSGLKPAQSAADVIDDTVDQTGNGERRLWINSVSREVWEGVGERERKRQENINEAIYTERDFVKDLEYLRDFWIIPLTKLDIIPAARRDKFVRTVFGNILDVHSVNVRLAEALTRRQQSSAVVHHVGDIFLEWIPKFEPFIRYGANQLWGKYEFEKEKSANPTFARWVDDVERKVESRKLELNGYLTKPTTRLARYPLLLEAICNHSADDNQDKQDLPKAVALVREFLAKVNVESGRAENKFNLMNLAQQLSNKPGETTHDLKLTEEGRQLLFKGALARRAVSLTANADSDLLQLFLFDHCLVVVKIKVINKRETYRIYRKPIPLELLILGQSDDSTASRGGMAKRPSSGLLPPAKTSTMGINLPGRNTDPANKGYAMTFTYLGRRGYNITLFAQTWVSRRKWIEHIEAQQKLIRERSMIFSKVVVCEKYFMGNNKVNCAVSFDGGRKLAYGTDSGIYVSDRKPHSNAKTTPIRVHPLANVVQIDVLEEYGLLLVLCDKSLSSYPIELLTDLDNATNFQMNRRAKKISGHVNFFKTGVCLGRVFLCVVKNNSINSTIKVLEPVEGLNRGRTKLGFAKLLQGGQDFKIFKEFYIPTESSSLHFLKSKVCVGCSKGFEIVDLDSLETQSLLDPADTSLDFVTRKEGSTPKPIAIYRFNGLFLLCYDEFAFFVNKNGWRAKHDWQVNWEGRPTNCAVAYPYLFAFEPSFVEIHSLETGTLAQIIPGSNIRLLADGRGKLGEGGEILFACENSLPGAAGGMDGECQVNALIKTGLDTAVALSPRIRHSEDG